VVVVIPLFTVGFTYPEDWFFPSKAISYWWGQHSIERVAGPPWYHLPRLAAYEFLPIAAALAWAVRRWRRMRVVEWSLLLFGVASVAMYAYLGEKVAWLGVHQVWAFLPLAGLQLARTFGPTGRWWSRSLAGVGLAATVVVTVSASFVNDEISPNLKRCELLIYVQTTPEVLEVVREGYALAEEGYPTVAAVSGYAGWPLTWYWRTTPTWWSQPRPDLRPPLVICEPDEEETVRKLLGPQYSAERIPFRAWWVIEHFKPTLTDVLRWLVTRVPWGDVGSSDVIVFRDTGEPSTEAREVEVPEVLAEELDATRARIVGEGWLMDPRGLSVTGDGRLAVADVALNKIVFFDAEGRYLDLSPAEAMDRPEAVAWAPAEVLVAADTWHHRVLLFRPGEEGVRELPDPDGGWFGPRGVAVGPDGTIAIADTGNKRVVLYQPAGADFLVRSFGGEGTEPGRFSEPVGIVWLDSGRLLICDTGNRRVQILDSDGNAELVVDLGEGWSDFFSRPQAAILGLDRYLVSDTPSRSLWLIDNGAARRIDLGEASISPTGLAFDDGVLYMSDTLGRVWLFDLAP
jgi:DNA-binding beta-propeller fold protein YncE